MPSYEYQKWHQQHPTPVEAQVEIADMKARIRDGMIRATHVRVGDHDPEPRRVDHDSGLRLVSGSFVGQDEYNIGGVMDIL